MLSRFSETHRTKRRSIGDAFNFRKHEQRKQQALSKFSASRNLYLRKHCSAPRHFCYFNFHIYIISRKSAENTVHCDENSVMTFTFLLFKVISTYTLFRSQKLKIKKKIFQWLIVSIHNHTWLFAKLLSSLCKATSLFLRFQSKYS